MKRALFISVVLGVSICSCNKWPGLLHMNAEIPIWIISVQGRPMAAYAAFRFPEWQGTPYSEGPCFPDTSVRNQSNFIWSYSYYHPMIPYGEKDRLGRGSCVCRVGGSVFAEWRDVIFKSLPADTLSIFIFSQDTLDKYDWEDIQRGYKVLQRYDISFDDFVKRHGEFYYPPTPDMKHIHMLPRYTDTLD